MFEKIRRAFIKLFNRRSIRVLDGYIGVYNTLANKYEPLFENEPNNDTYRHLYLLYLYIVNELRECKQQITYEGGIEL